MLLQIWKSHNCRGEHLKNLRRNLEYLITTFASAATEAGHMAYKDAPNRKLKKSEVTPDAETLDKAFRSPWMMETVKELLQLRG